MRICISAPSLDTFGGAERVIISDADEFSQKGNDVYIISDSIKSEVTDGYGSSDSTTYYEYCVDQIPYVPDIFGRIMSIRKLLKEIQPDVVIAHYEETATWLALNTLPIHPVFTTHVHGSIFWFEDIMNKAAHSWKKCTRKVINDVPGHSEFWEAESISLRQKANVLIQEVFEGLTLRACDEIFVNTNQVSTELDCLYDVNARVSRPGIDIKKEDTNRNIKITDDQPYILSVCRLDSRKRIGLLINAVSKLFEQREDIILVIGGSGPESDHLKRLVSEKGVQDRVIFLGHIDEKDLPAYYSNAEIFACPGWMSYGLTPLEAIHFDTKVALSSDAFVKEVVGSWDGVNVMSPEVDSWVDGINTLLDSNVSPPRDRLPSSQNHAEEKMKSFKRELDCGINDRS